MRKTHQKCNRWKIWGGIFFACVIVGCKSTTGVSSSGTAITKTEETFFTSVLDHSLRYETFSARMNLDFSSLKKELNSRVQVKIIYNDRMQLSVQPVFGIEVFRIELSDDSIKILDRMNKRYVADNYNELKQKADIDINFQNVQSLFTNRIFVPGENHISTNHFRQFRVKKSDQTAELQLKGRDKTLYTFIADSDEKLLSTSIENEPQKQQLSWTYSQFQTIDNQPFPMKMTAQLSSENQIQGTATLTFSNPVLNSPVTMDFIIPAGYSRITLEQLINSLVKK